MAASSPVMIVRVAATIEELRRNLAEGRSQVEVTAQGMQKMVTAFDGTKIVAQANNVTAAVHAIGGASQLTGAEQAKVNRIVEEALAKYAALGKEAPAGMRQLAADTKQADTASSGLTDTVKTLAAGFAAMFTARAAFNFVSKTIEEASALKDLSQQTHIGVEDLQLLAGGMSEFGVDADELGKGLFKLSRGIAGGDESVASGLHLMGLSLKDVEGLNGKDLFLKIESGLATLQGGLRDTAAAELFGGKLGAAMAGASEGIGDTMEKWQALNHVASSESVDAMDQFGESITRAEKNLSAVAANLIGPVTQGFNTLTDAADKGASKWAIFWAMTKDGAAATLGLGTGTEHLTKLLDDQNQKTEQSVAATKKSTEAHQGATVALTAQAAAQKFMASLELDAAKPLLAWQTEYLGHLKEIGALNAKNAAGIGVNVQQFKAYEESTKKATEADKKRTEQEAAGLLATTKLWDDYFTLRTAHGGTANDQAIAQIDKWAADLTAQMQKAGSDTKEFYDALAAVSKEKLGAVGVNWDLWKTHSIAAQNEIADNELKTLNAMIASGQFHREEIDKQRAKYEEARDAARGYGADSVAAQEQAARSAKEHTAALEAQKKAIEEAAAAERNRAMGNTLDLPHAVAADPELADLLHMGWSLENAEQILLSRKFGFAPKLHGPKGTAENAPDASERVPGYDVGVLNAPGGWATIGERGPERMYVPPGANIYPSGSSAGGTTIQIYITQPLGTPTAIARAVDDALMKRQRAIGTRF